MDPALTSATPGIEATVYDHSGDGYDALLALVRDRGRAVGPLFTTDATGLFDRFLAHVGPDPQHYNCNACRRFLDGYGGLVTIDAATGRTSPVFWDPAGPVPAFFAPAFVSLAQRVASAKVTGVFLAEPDPRHLGAAVLGTPQTPERRPGRPAATWHHLAATLDPANVWVSSTRSADQKMAERREDYATVQRALAAFTGEHLAEALRLLESEALYRAEKVIGPVRWLRDLQAARSAARGPARDNLVWRAVATAPAGFCHPRSSMAGTLLEDIAAGMGFADVAARFAAKMAPLAYQRPVAAPSAGNIARAEALVAKLGIAPSLRRRFARIEDVTPHALWVPRPPAAPPAAEGVFGHLRPKEAGPAVRPLVTPPRTMTWSKFRREVLPGAEAIEYLVPAGLGPFAAILTAADPDAPPILQWDRPDRRNPASWYVYPTGSSPDRWGLVPGQYRRVTAVAFQPSMWGDEDGAAHQGRAVVFCLEDCRDRAASGAMLFPEILKAELREVRATIEAHSKSARLEGAEEASACGVRLQHDPTARAWNATFRVAAGGATAVYTLDRWD